MELQLCMRIKLFLNSCEINSNWATTSDLFKKKKNKGLIRHLIKISKKKKNLRYLKHKINQKLFNFLIQWHTQKNSFFLFIVALRGLGLDEIFFLSTIKKKMWRKMIIGTESIEQAHYNTEWWAVCLYIKIYKSV